MGLITTTNQQYYDGQYIFYSDPGVLTLTSFAVPKQFTKLHNSGYSPEFIKSDTFGTSNFEIYVDTSGVGNNYVKIDEKIQGQLNITATNAPGGGLSESGTWIPANPTPSTALLVPDATSTTSGSGAALNFSFPNPAVVDITVDKVGKGYKPGDTLVFTVAQFLAAGITVLNDIEVVLDNAAVYGYTGDTEAFVYTVQNNLITFQNGNLIKTPNISAIKVQLKQHALWNNYGNYEYISLSEVVNNFLMAYVGYGKVVSKVKRTDVLFHAKRGIQEFSYDTLKSIRKLEIEMPPSLSYPIPQDYVNYVRLGWVDSMGVFHPIYPLNTLVQYPTEVPIQDGTNDALPTFGNYGETLEADQSETEKRWKDAVDNNLTGAWEEIYDDANVNNWTWRKGFLGRRYGMNPVISQSNGWYAIDRRKNSFAFSSDLANKIVTIEYISDGLAYDEDMKVPKMAEEALYMHIMHGIVSTRAGIPEYIVG